MSNLEDHIAEQEAITARYERAVAMHGDITEEIKRIRRALADVDLSIAFAEDLATEDQRAEIDTARDLISAACAKLDEAAAIEEVTG